MGKYLFTPQNIKVDKLNVLTGAPREQTGIADFSRDTCRVAWAQDLTTKPKWTEKDGVIYFSVTSDGTTGKQWIDRLESKGFRIEDYAKSVLCSKRFQFTSGITYEIAILKSELLGNDERVIENICRDAKSRQYAIPNTEVACLIRERFSDQELEAMKLDWIVTMHKPIKDSGGVPVFLSADRYGDGSWLCVYYGSPGHKLYRGDSFAFVVSEGFAS